MSAMLGRQMCVQMMISKHGTVTDPSSISCRTERQGGKVVQMMMGIIGESKLSDLLLEAKCRLVQ